MDRAKASGSRGRGGGRAAACTPGLKAADNTTAAGAKSSTSAAGSRTRNVTTKAKASTESTRGGTSALPPHSDKAVPLLPTSKEQSSGPSSSKSKIPKRAGSDSDVKSPVTADKPSVADASGSKPQKQPRSKDALKSPLAATNAARKQSFEEKAPSGDVSPTKVSHKTGTKLVKEKADEKSDSAQPVNGVQNEERSVPAGRPAGREAARQQGQTRLEENACLASKSRLPVSSPMRKCSDEATQSGTNEKRTTSGPAGPDRSSTTQKPSPEQREVTPGERPSGATPGSPKKGSMLATRPSKLLSKSSMSHEERDTPATTKQDNNVSSRLPKQSDNIKHHTSPVKDPADPPSSGSKLPTRGQRSSNTEKSRKLSSTEDSASTSTSKREDSNQDSNTETTVAASESVRADEVEDNAGGDILKVKSLSAKGQEQVMQLTENQPSNSENQLKGNETKGSQESITGPATKEISKVHRTQNNNATVLENSQGNGSPVSGPGAQVLPSSEVDKPSPSEPLVTEVKDEGDGRLETKQPTQTESQSQSDNNTQEQETLISTKICPEETKEKDILDSTQMLSNSDADSIQERGLAELNEDVTDTPAKPVESSLCDIMTPSDQEAVLPGSVSLKEANKVTAEEYNCRNDLPASKHQDAEPTDGLPATSVDVSGDASLPNIEQPKELLEDQTTNVLIKNDGLPKLSRDLVQDVEVEEKSSRKSAEALNIQTQTETVCELPKNVENQLDKEALLLAGELERQKKKSKSTEKLDDTAVESTDSQDSCKEKLNGTTIKDEAEKEVTKTQRPIDSSSGEACSQPASEERSQVGGGDALEEKKTQPARRALHENTASVTDTKQECEIVSKENAKSGNKETDQQLKTQTMTNDLEPKVPIAKDQMARDTEAYQEDKHAAVEKKSPTPELKATKTTTEEESETKDLLIQNLPNEMLNETTDSEVMRHEEQNSLIARDRDEDVKKRKAEEKACRSAESKCPNVDIDQKPVTEKAPETTTERHILQMETPQDRKAVSSETQSAECAEEKTETKESSVKSLVNETPMTSEAPKKVSESQTQGPKVIGTTTQSDDGAKEKTETKDSSVKSLVNETPKKVSESQIQGPKVLNTTTHSAKEAEEKTETKDSSVKTLVNETPMTTETPKKISESQTQGPKVMSTTTQSANEAEEKTEPKDSPVQSLVIETPKTTAAPKKVSEGQTQGPKVVSTTTQSDDGAKEKTETKDSSVKSLVKEIPMTSETPKKVSESQIQGPKVMSTTTQSDDGAKEKTETKDSSVKTLVNETPKKVSESQTQGPKVIGKTTQSDDGAKEKTETKDSSVKSLVNETLVISGNSKASIQQDQRLNIIKDQREDINTQDIGQSTESILPNTELKQELERTEAPKKVSESQTQGLKVIGTTTQSDDGAKERTGTKDSSVKTLVKEIPKKVSEGQTQGPKVMSTTTQSDDGAKEKTG
ncbi:enolase-phosphatase E1-like, partial [Clinocottus analis]|uniref:enolase-phosphatase E1-like n=1 Tax=Clinocottus analis TaxID=304258 RepID=UPI0035BFB2E5